MSRVPIVYRVSWPALGLHLLCFLALVWMLKTVWYGEKYSGYAVPAAMLAYMACSLALRSTIAASHRSAIRLVRQGRFEEAIPHYAASYEFFRRHAWVDRFRAVTLFSFSGISYREMALVGSAFCHTQIGEGRKARELYERALSEFPNSGMATTALNVMDAGRQSN